MSPQSHNAVSDALILWRYSFKNDLPVRSCARMAASELISCWHNPAAFPRWSAASIFLVDLPVLDLPDKSGPVVISALFKACVTRYYKRLSLCGGSSLSSLVAALVSLSAFSFPTNPEWPGIQYSVTLFS